MDSQWCPENHRWKRKRFGSEKADQPGKGRSRPTSWSWISWRFTSASMSPRHWARLEPRSQDWSLFSSHCLICCCPFGKRHSECPKPGKDAESDPAMSDNWLCWRSGLKLQPLPGLSWWESWGHSDPNKRSAVGRINVFIWGLTKMKEQHHFAEGSVAYFFHF